MNGDRSRRFKVDPENPSCQDCSEKLLIGDNWTKYRRSQNRYVCSPCYSKKQLDYRNRLSSDEKLIRKRASTARRMANWDDVRREKERRRRYSNWLKIKYGMTVEDYDLMLIQQGGRCAICFTDEPRGKGTFHVDHCHATSIVRGLLCSKCNILLGHADDNIERLEKAIAYLRERGI